MKKLCKILYLLIIIFVACDDYTPANIVIVDKKTSRDEDGALRLTVTIENRGGVPAKFVIVQAKALVQKQEAEYHEKEFGDLFPGGRITDFLLFYSFPVNQPDEFDIRIVYTE